MAFTAVALAVAMLLVTWWRPGPVRAPTEAEPAAGMESSRGSAIGGALVVAAVVALYALLW